MWFGRVSVLIVLLVAIGNCDGFDLQAWLTTGDQTSLLEQLPDILPTDEEPYGFNVWVNKSETRQTIDGFGASITNAAAYVIFNSPYRHNIMQDLFGSGPDDLGVSYIRVPIGASDMQAVSPYSYDDLNGTNATDFDMEHFSIEKDYDFIIPILKEAMEINPKLKVLGSPWSAPGWMKTSNHLFGGTFIEDPLYYDAFAKYLVMFIEAYEAEGIPIDTITVQNEPLIERDYPTMVMNTTSMTEFIKNHLGPLMVEMNVTTKLLIWDWNWIDPWYPEFILQDEEVKQYVAGVTWHGYDGFYDTPKHFHAEHPDMDMYMSEVTGGDWGSDTEEWADQFEYMASMMYIGQPASYSRNVILWNMALDETSGPKSPDVGGCPICRPVVTVPSDGSNYIRRVDYYSMGHLSKFVKTGATRIESNSNFPEQYKPSSNFTVNVTGDMKIVYDWDLDDGVIQTVAFINEDESTVVVVNNPHPVNNISFYLDIDGLFYQYTDLPPQSIVTFKQDRTPPGTISVSD